MNDDGSLIAVNRAGIVVDVALRRHTNDVSGGEQRGPLSGGIADPSVRTRPAAMSSPAVSPWTLNAWESFPPASG